MASKFVSHVLPGVLRPLRILWNQVIGFLFLAFAAFAVPRALNSWGALQKDADAWFHFALSLLFIFIMGGFGLFSFLRARKISRS